MINVLKPLFSTKSRTNSVINLQASPHLARDVNNYSLTLPASGLCNINAYSHRLHKRNYVNVRLLFDVTNCECIPTFYYLEWIILSFTNFIQKVLYFGEISKADKIYLKVKSTIFDLFKNHACVSLNVM